MSALLAVETSGSLCSLAIHVSGRWFEDTQNVERLHNQLVLRILDGLAASAGVRPAGFRAVAFGAGPGSFTGVRIAAAVAQGVALASGGIVLPVPSSRALAAAARRHPGAPGAGGRLLTVTRSRRDAYYLAGYALPESGAPEPWLDDRLHQGTAPPADLPEYCPGAGDRPPWWPGPRPFLEGVTVTARDVGDLALHMLAGGEGVAAEAGLPVYVTGDSPWQPMDR